MAFQVSPGVNVSEIDLTNIIPAVSTSIGATVGSFVWGPTKLPVLVSSETQLVEIFGEPKKNFNEESFFTAANFLGYSNALYVTRVEGTATNAWSSNTSANASTVTVGSVQEYDSDFSTLSDQQFIAKYPGSLGNNLEVHICGNANVYNSTIANSVVGQVTFEPGQTTVSGFTGTTGLTVGDYIKVNGDFYKLTTVNANDIAFTPKFRGVANVDVTTIERYWEFYNVVDRAPQNSKYAADNGITGTDEVHVVVVDAGGGITGTKDTVLEVFEGLSTINGAKSENGTDISLATALNTRSNWIWRGGAAIGDIPQVDVDNFVAGDLDASAPTVIRLGGAEDSAPDASETNAARVEAFDFFKSTDEYDISLIIAGKANATLVNYLIDNIAEVRKDCVVFCSPEKSDVVSSNKPISSITAIPNIIDFRNNLTSSSYAVLDSGYKYQYDKYNDQYVWIPLCADSAGAAARTDNERDPWFSPAGFSRGTFKNVVKLAVVPTKAERDELYKADVNPVVTFPGQGTVLYGDKTLLGRASAFDRINVRRLFIVLEKAISNAANSLLFEFNDDITRAQFRNAVVPFLREVQGRRGITDFSVICDDTNNTAEVIDQNQFVGDIYIKPARSINFIQLNFIAVRTGVEFSEVVGSV